MKKLIQINTADKELRSEVKVPEKATLTLEEWAVKFNYGSPKHIRYEVIDDGE